MAGAQYEIKGQRLSSANYVGVVHGKHSKLSGI